MERTTDGRAEQPEAIYQELLIVDSCERYYLLFSAIIELISMTLYYLTKS